jgi:hypothetical protein
LVCQLTFTGTHDIELSESDIAYCAFVGYLEKQLKDDEIAIPETLGSIPAPSPKEIGQLEVS